MIEANTQKKRNGKPKQTHKRNLNVNRHAKFRNFTFYGAHLSYTTQDRTALIIFLLTSR